MLNASSKQIRETLKLKTVMNKILNFGETLIHWYLGRYNKLHRQMLRCQELQELQANHSIKGVGETKTK